MTFIPVRVAAMAAAALLGLFVLAVALLPLALVPDLRNALAATPDDVGLAYDEISIDADGMVLPAWWIPAAASDGVLVVVHDGSSNRSFLWEGGMAFLQQMQAQDLSLLVFDLPGHGAAPELGETPTGDNAAFAVQAAVEEARRRSKDLPIFVHGFGLGGVVSLYAVGQSDVAAISVDSVWGNLKESMAATIPDVTIVPSILMRPSLWVADVFYGTDFDGSRPLSIVDDISMPALFIVNAADRQVLPAHSHMLSQQVERGHVWVTDAPPTGHPVYEERGSWGTHTQSFKLNPEGYVKRLMTFYSTAQEVRS